MKSSLADSDDSFELHKSRFKKLINEIDVLKKQEEDEIPQESDSESQISGTSNILKSLETPSKSKSVTSRSQSITPEMPKIAINQPDDEEENQYFDTSLSEISKNPSRISKISNINKFNQIEEETIEEIKDKIETLKDKIEEIKNDTLNSIESDDKFEFVSPIKIKTPNKHPKRRNRFNQSEIKIEDPTEEKKGKNMQEADKKFIEMMALMDEAIEKKEMRDKKRSMEEGKFIKFKMEMVNAIEANSKPVVQCLKGLSLVYKIVIDDIRVLPIGESSSVISKEILKSYLKFMKKILQGSVFSVYKLKEVFNYVREGELNLALDRISMLIAQNQDFKLRFEENDNFLFCEFITCLVVSGHITFRNEIGTKGRSCNGECFKIFVRKLRENGYKRGFPLFRNLKTEKINSKKRNREMLKSTVKVEKKKDEESKLFKEFKKYEVKDKKKEEDYESLEAHIIMENLNQLVLVFLSDCYYTNFEPRFCPRILTKSIIKSLETTFNDFEIFRREKPNFSIEVEKMINLSNKMMKDRNFENLSQKSIGVNFRKKDFKKMKNDFDKENGYQRPQSVISDQTKFTNVFEKIFYEENKILEKVDKNPKVIDSVIFGKKSIEWILEKFGKLFDFSHFLLIIILSLKFFIFSERIKHRFIQNIQLSRKFKMYVKIS